MHQNTANIALQTEEKNQWTFLWHRRGVDFSSRNNFTNLGSFAKVSVPVETIIPSLVYTSLDWFAFKKKNKN